MLITDIKKIATEGRFGRAVENVSEHAKTALSAVVEELENPKYTSRTFKAIAKNIEEKNIAVSESDVALVLMGLIETKEVFMYFSGDKMFYRLKGHTATTSPIVSEVSDEAAACEVVE